jgi:IclR family transcriptional regulator, KDG regulon repressor
LDGDARRTARVRPFGVAETPFNFRREAMVDTIVERLKKPKPRRMRLSSVANAIRLTKAFSEHEYEMGISALAGRLGLAKSTVHRLATTLVEYDILEQNRESGKYRLGLALFELGTLVRRKMDAVSESRQQMSALLEMTGETVQLAVLDHLSVLYIRILESRQAVRMSSTVGSRAPAHCTSVGKALLAFQSPEVVKQVMDAGLRRYTANTITTPELLQEELASVRVRGYAVDDEESEVGLRCVAVPIRDHTGLVAAALSVSAPVQRMTKKNLQTTVPTVVAAAEAISRRLGYLPSLSGAHAVE